MKATFKLPDDKAIAALKKMHGEIQLVTTPAGHKALVRKPRIEDLQRSFRFPAESIEAEISIYGDCWIDGDAKIKPTPTLLGDPGDPFTGDAEQLLSAAKKTILIFAWHPSSLVEENFDDRIEAELKNKGVDYNTIKALKTDGVVRKLTVKYSPANEDGGHLPVEEITGYLRKPGFTELTNSQLVGNDNYQKGSYFLNNCWITGDERLKTGDEEICFSAAIGASRLFFKQTAAAVKL